MDYLMKASGLVMLLFLFYQLFLKNETFFKSIRSYFLIGLILVISLPLLEIPVYVEYVSQQINMSSFEEINASQATSSSLDWIVILQTTYLIGVLFFSVKFIVQLISLAYLIISHKSTKQGNHYYIETTKDISPFSFFNYIVFNNKQFTSTELDQIINHEKAHAMQWHSIDTLLAHILVILLWFNPFVWLYKKAVQQNLEFLADSYALKLADNQKMYQLTLLKMFQQNYCTEITNNFYNSLIKKRITMLHKNRSTSKNQWKYALLIPLLTLFVFAFNTKTIAQERKIIEVVEDQKNFVEIINKDFQKSDLELVKKRLKADGIEFNYSNLKFNSKNEIIKLSVKLKNESGKASATWERKDKPIPTIYVGENDGQLIASSSPQKELEIHTFNKKHSNGDVKFLSNEDLKKGKYLFVSTDGKKNTWTSKDGKKEKIIVREIYKGDKDHVWIKKGDNNENEEIIEVVEGENKIHVVNESDEKNIFILKEEGEKHKRKTKKAKFISEDGVTIDLDIEEDNASENVFIIKNKDGKLIQEKKEKNVMVFSSGKEKPIVYINGKLSTNEALKALDPDTIEKMEVLKGENAIEKYGEKAKNGVIIITLKNKSTYTVEIDDNTNLIEGINIVTGKEPIYEINGIEKTKKEALKIKSNNIKSITALRGKAAIDKYGKKGENGVMVITTKN